LTFIVALALLGLGLARLLGAPPGVWRPVLAAAVLAALGSQLLPAGHPLRVDVAGSARSLGWLGLALAPVVAYALGIRWLRRRTGVGAPAAPGHLRGLVQFADDTRLTADTEAALDEEAAASGAAARFLSLGWRTDGGSLAGHLRMRQTADTAEVLLLRVAPQHRRQGIGARLLAAAEGEARARGARRMWAAPGSWQAPDVFARAGYRTVAERPLGPGLSRLWMERELR
jgi:GNAT superfamily N-acetyltransferase